METEGEIIMRKAVLRIVALATIVVAASATAETVLTGQTGGGAYYRIAVPDNWNGDLVIWNHGFTLAPPSPIAPDSDPEGYDLGPLAQLQLAEGYAVAASSYQQNGWALFKTRNDLNALIGVFKARFGPPDEIIVTGASLGGLVTIQAVEGNHLGNVTGAYTVCGAIAGSRVWDAIVDQRLIYDAVCASTPGAGIPGGATGLPVDSTLTILDMVLRVHECTGILAPPPYRTPQQQANLDQILLLTRAPEDFLLTNMYFGTFGLQNLTFDAAKLKGRIGAGNAMVTYGDPQIDADIERVVPHPGGANRLGNSYTPNGDVGQTKIVSLHTDKDGLVVVENESSYASLVPAGNLTTAIVVEEIPSHCDFSVAEVVAGWESLRAWLTGSPQPTAESIQGLCEDIAPTFGGPCRIDPEFVVPDIDSRIRPR